MSIAAKHVGGAADTLRAAALIARRLEDGCDGSAEPPLGASLRSCACTLDGI